MAGELDMGKVVGDPGPGVPAGGAAGKFLRKRSSADYDIEFADAVQTINGEQPDANGNYNVIRTQFARQIETDSNHSSSGEFLYRTTGGDASISDGDATLVGIYGRRIHTGYVAEVLDMTVNAAAREEGQYAITAELNKDTFRLYVPSSRTVTLTYTSAWSENPTLYGVSVTGTPVSGDEIVIVYVKEERGTITHSTPEAFVSTGWNLYNNAVGYARVKKYSDTYGFLVGGNYTGLQYSETLDGAKTPITVAGSAFTVPGDGYVWVTGGDATTTYIMMTWSDWGSGPEGGFKAYTESVIDLSSILALMPYGCLAQVGGVADTIDFSVGMATSNVERLAYSGENMEMAAASGRPYEYDENYIYISRVTPLVYEFTLGSTFTANDHGMELISGSAVGVFVETIYGENLVDKLRTDIPNKLAAHDQQIANLQDGLAIIANGNTHAAVAAGQAVYVRNHSTLAEGLYWASSAIAANVALSTSNLTADASGGFNKLKGDIDSLNSNLTPVEYALTSSMFLRKFGKVCVLSGYHTWSSTMSGDSTIGTLPAEYRPKFVVRTLANIGANAWSYNRTAYFIVSDTGDVSVVPADSNGYVALYVNCSWVLA